MELYDPNASYVSGTSEKPLIGSTIGDLFDRVANSLPDNEALVSRHQNLRYTYRQLKEEADRFARGLMALGVQKGDRVGIWSPNYAEWVVTQFATPKIGAILVNINPAYRTSELEYVLKQAGISTLIIAPRFKTSDYVAMLSEVCPEMGSAQPGRISCAQLPDLHTAIVLGDDAPAGTYSWTDIMNRAESVPGDELARVQSEQQFDDPINIQYTSGTTGFPKGATLNHHGILNNGYFIGEKLRFTERDRLCIPVPFYHCFGMVLGNPACVTHGAAMSPPGDSFEPESGLKTRQ